MEIWIVVNVFVIRKRKEGRERNEGRERDWRIGLN